MDSILPTQTTNPIQQIYPQQQIVPAQTPENKAPLQISGGYYDGQTWAVMKMMAQTFVEGKAFGDSVALAQVMVRLQAGRELGLMPIESGKYIAVINGRPSLWGEKAIELVIRAGHRVDWGKCDEKTATCTITRCDTGQSMSQTFTRQMAEERGLTKKGGSWISAPDNMLKFKAFHAIAKFLVPDALRGASIAEIEETEGPGAISPVAASGVMAMAALTTQATNTKLKPLAIRIAEKAAAKEEDKKETVIEAKFVESEVVAAKMEEEPTYEPITPPEPTTPVIQAEAPSPLPPPKKAEGVAARKMREAAEKAVAAKSSNDF